MPAYANAKSRFGALWERTIGKGGAAAAWRALNTGYSDPHRAYHNWSHITAMLAGLDEAQAATEVDGADLGAVELAIFFHDAVYDPRAKDNETKSADLFRSCVSDTHLDKAMADHIIGMILATATHPASSDKATRLLLDLDLRVLGGTSEQYLGYSDAVRAEYAFIPEEQWRLGRTAVLRGFLDRTAIYQTAYFLTRYEALARANLQSEIEKLTLKAMRAG